jgi:hypothetical protein
VPDEQLNTKRPRKGCRIDAKVMTTEAWLALHRGHGDLTEQKHDHPSGTWRWLVCECGARHLTEGGA